MHPCMKVYDLIRLLCFLVSIFHQSKDSKLGTGMIICTQMHVLFLNGLLHFAVMMLDEIIFSSPSLCGSFSVQEPFPKAKCVYLKIFKIIFFYFLY